jgi:glycerol-3-phosphate dehydrogenase
MKLSPPFSASNSPATRAENFARLRSETFDVVVIGGGATGAATARDAALRGLKTALVECGDFASQTSSASSRLIHGGLRYLQYGNFGLVFEGLAERRRLMRTAAHLCQPVDFVFPAYNGSKPSLGTIGVGIRLYNLLALWQKPSKRERLSARQLAEQAPLLRKEGLQGAQIYQDCQTDDARLVLENVLDAQAAGAVCLNYTRASFPHKTPDKRFAIGISDLVSDAKAFSVRTRAFVNATGPFSDVFSGTHRLRPTLGVHIVVDAKRLGTNNRVFVLNTPQDGRLFFVMPSGSRTSIGTTDTDWINAGKVNAAAKPGDPIMASRIDVDYLLTAANAAFPEAKLTHQDVLSTWAGLRPLVAALDSSPSATSREHEIFFDEGAITVVGGKLTTMRKMGEQVVNRLCSWGVRRGLSVVPRVCTTAKRPLPGGAVIETSIEAERALKTLPTETQEHLRSRYGLRAAQVAAMVSSSKELALRLQDDLPDIWAEVVFATRYELAITIEDVLRRRMSIFRNGREQGLDVVQETARLMAIELNASDETKARWIDGYRSAVAITRRWMASAPAASPETAP